MLGRINDAENRAREAENRAREAVAGVARPFEPPTLDSPPPAAPSTPRRTDSGCVRAATARTAEPAPPPVERIAPEPPAAPEPSPAVEPTADDPVSKPGCRRSRRPPSRAARPGAGRRGADSSAIRLPDPSEMSSVQFLPLNLNDATFEQLRDVGLSVTQTGRVLAHRERSGRFESVDELEGIPGFPQDFLTQIKSRLTV